MPRMGIPNGLSSHEGVIFVLPLGNVQPSPAVLDPWETFGVFSVSWHAPEPGRGAAVPSSG